MVRANDCVSVGGRQQLVVVEQAFRLGLGQLLAAAQHLEWVGGDHRLTHDAEPGGRRRSTGQPRPAASEHDVGGVFGLHLWRVSRPADAGRARRDRATVPLDDVGQLVGEAAAGRQWCRG